VANSRALAGDAHTATAFFLVWGVYLLICWSQTMSVWPALGAGVLLGVVPTIRYPAVVFGLAVGVFMLTYARRGRQAVLTTLAAVGGAMIPIIILAIRNQMAFGAFWRTGYALTNEQTGFGLQYFARNAVQYIENVQGRGAGLFAALGWVGMILLTARRATWRVGVLLLMLVVPLTLVYMSYYWAPGHMPGATMRFLVPTFFFYTVAGLWLLKQLMPGRAAGVRAATIAVIALTVCWGIPSSIELMARDSHMNGALAKITQAVSTHVKPGSVIVSNQKILQHLDFIGEWRLADESVLLGRGRGMGRPGGREGNTDAPSPRQTGKMEAAQKRYGSRRGRGVSDEALDDVEAWAGAKRKVYWLGTPDSILPLLPREDRLEEVARIKLPKMKTDTRRGRGGPGGGPPRGMGPPGGGPAFGRRSRGFGRRGRGRGADILRSGGELILSEWTWPDD